jgi:hypothetical protein
MFASLKHIHTVQTIVCEVKKMFTRSKNVRNINKKHKISKFFTSCEVVNCSLIHKCSYTSKKLQVFKNVHDP